MISYMGVHQALEGIFCPHHQKCPLTTGGRWTKNLSGGQWTKNLSGGHGGRPCMDLALFL